MQEMPLIEGVPKMLFHMSREAAEKGIALT